MKKTRLTPRFVAALVATLASQSWAGFSGTDVFLPSVGRASGAKGSQWYTTMWIHNPGPRAANAQVFFLKRDQPNLQPLVFSDVIQPGGTIRYDNAVTTLFGASGFGALRITSDQRLIVNGRVYSQPQGGGDRDSVGQFFSAVPADFAIGTGQSTSLLGVYQTSPQADSQFRYNFGFVETTGNPVTVRVTARDHADNALGFKSYSLAARDAQQYNVTDVVPGVDSPNLRLTVEVLSGAGKVVAFGSGIANTSNDPSTFEMLFRDELLGGGGGGDTVFTDTTLTGDGTSSAPLGIADRGAGPAKLSASGSSPGQVLTSDGTNVTWQDPSGDGSNGIAAVVHDATLSGSGTLESPLGIAGNGVTTEKLADSSVGSAKIIDGSVGPQDLANGAVRLANLAAGTATAGQVLGTDGAKLKWQAAGGLTLPYAGSAATAASADVVRIQNTGAGRALHAVTNSDIAVLGSTASGRGVVGQSATAAGVRGESTSGNGVYGTSTSGYGVSGTSQSSDGVLGTTQAAGSSGVVGSSTAGIGITGISTDNVGIQARTSSSNPNTPALWAQNYGAGPALVADAGSDGYAAVFTGRAKTSSLEITGGSDFSEQFVVPGAPGGRPRPGTVVSIDTEHEGALTISRSRYDRSVAGVVSGAGGVSPGMVMGQAGSAASGDVPVALSGRVYCWADASYGAIAPGDLLTTSDTPGHAMRASDAARASGAVLGKAMSALPSGRGLILVLVTLQ